MVPINFKIMVLEGVGFCLWDTQNFLLTDLVVVAILGHLFSKLSIFILCVFLYTCYNLQLKGQVMGQYTSINI